MLLFFFNLHLKFCCWFKKISFIVLKIHINIIFRMNSILVFLFFKNIMINESFYWFQSSTVSLSLIFSEFDFSTFWILIKVEAKKNQNDFHFRIFFSFVVFFSFFVRQFFYFFCLIQSDWKIKLIVFFRNFFFQFINFFWLIVLFVFFVFDRSNGSFNLSFKSSTESRS